jgi:choline dehydrogenase-like flavoprotein
MAVQKRVNMVTVGAGWTAGILAHQLTEAGMDIVSLEQGPARWATPDFEHNHDALRHQVRTALMIRFTPARALAARASTGPASTGASSRPISATARTTSRATAKRACPLGRWCRTGR